VLKKDLCLKAIGHPASVTAMRARSVALAVGGTDFVKKFSPLKTWAFRHAVAGNVPVSFAKTVTSR
jgi:hypothetical protein